MKSDSHKREYIYSQNHQLTQTVCDSAKGTEMHWFALSLFAFTFFCRICVWNWTCRNWTINSADGDLLGYHVRSRTARSLRHPMHAGAESGVLAKRRACGVGMSPPHKTQTTADLLTLLRGQHDSMYRLWPKYAAMLETEPAMAGQTKLWNREINAFFSVTLMKTKEWNVVISH